MNKDDQILQIKAALQSLQPTHLEIVDESDRHRGHGGWIEGQVTHVHVKIASVLFDGLTRIQQHRLVNEKLFINTEKNLHSVKISIVGCA